MFDGRRGVPAAGRSTNASTAGNLCSCLQAVDKMPLQTSLGLCRSVPSRLVGSFARGGIGGLALAVDVDDGILHTDRASCCEALRQIASIPVTNPRARPWRCCHLDEGPAADQSNLPSA